MAPRKKDKAATKSHTRGQNPPNQGSRSAEKLSDPRSLPVELQQSVLDIFCRAFYQDPRHRHELKVIIQEVKGYLFLRDFTRAFAKPEYLDAYALRWSASRALGYLDILLHCDPLRPVWLGEITHSSPDPAVHSPPSTTKSASTVACIGGGAGAEVAACAAAGAAEASASFLPHASASRVEIHAIDIADWSSCIEKLTTALTTSPPLSAYASEGAKAANKPLVDAGRIQVSFSQHDVLNMVEDSLRTLLGGVDLCTIMFTLNELFSSSIARTTAFLLALTETMVPGSWLLVVDSPGSYSEVKLGQGDNAKSKQYPMKWLIDHTLLEVAGTANRKWRKHVSDDSRWFRLSPSLKYPIELENMRYQIHLYQRTESEVS